MCRKKSRYQSVLEYFRRQTIALLDADGIFPGSGPESAPVPLKRSAVSYIPHGPCTSLSPGARTPTVPSPLPTSARSLVAAPATAATRAGQRHRHHVPAALPIALSLSFSLSPPLAIYLSVSFSFSLPEEFAHSAIHAALPATRAPRSTTNATYALSTSCPAPPPLLPCPLVVSRSSRGVARTPHLFLSIRPARTARTGNYGSNAICLYTRAGVQKDVAETYQRRLREPRGVTAGAVRSSAALAFRYNTYSAYLPLEKDSMGIYARIFMRVRFRIGRGIRILADVNKKR